MLKLFKIEISRALKNKLFLFSIAIGCLIAIFHLIQHVIPYAGEISWDKGEYPLSVFEKWIGATGYALQTNLFFLIAPILAALPFSDTFFLDKKSGYVKNVFTRTKKSYYYISKYISTFISGGLAIIIPLLLNLFLTTMFLPSIIPEPSTGTFTIIDLSMWSNIFYTYPLIYIFLYLVIDFIFYGLVATIALAISHYLENRFAVLLAPFLYYIIFSFVLSSTGKEIYNPLSFLPPYQAYAGFDFRIIAVEAVILMGLTISIFIIKGVKNETY